MGAEKLLRRSFHTTFEGRRERGDIFINSAPKERQNSPEIELLGSDEEAKAIANAVELFFNNTTHQDIEEVTNE